MLYYKKNENNLIFYGLKVYDEKSILGVCVSFLGHTSQVIIDNLVAMEFLSFSGETEVKRGDESRSLSLSL